MSERSLIKTIDNFLFEQISTIKAVSVYGDFQEFLANLNDDIRDIVKYAISMGLILIPFIFVLAFWSTNLGLKEDLEVHKMIYSQANKIIQEDKIFGEAGKSLISPGAPRTENDLSSKIGLLLSRARIDTQKIRVQNFNSESFSDKISQNTADIVFNDLTTEQLGKMASEIIFRQKAQINNIEVVRNDTKKLLEGKMSIVYLSQGDQ